jgi:NADH-quinone oxidoreductase subunit M
MLGPIDNEKNKDVKDISKFELSYMLPLLLFIVWIGVHPNTFLKLTENGVKKVLVNFENAKAYELQRGVEKK